MSIPSKKRPMWLIPVGVVVVGGIAVAASYNGLVSSDQQVQSQWAQVESVYQRRIDLIPNLVETVKGAANFEKSTYVAVSEARSQAGQNMGKNPTTDPTAFAKFQQSQDGLSSALSRLMVVVERYPDLKANENFRDLQAQIEGTENRIAVERMRFNEAAQGFNTRRSSFPTVMVASMFGSKFQTKQYFHSEPAAATPPKVKF